jgi:hypothetical protein
MIVFAVEMAESGPFVSKPMPLNCCWRELEPNGRRRQFWGESASTQAIPLNPGAAVVEDQRGGWKIVQYA